MWDPYCSATDILNTVFFCPFIGVPLKVIMAYRKGANHDNESVQQWKQSFVEQLKNGSDFKGINLEVRYQYGNNGWAFHDRFLLFPGEPPHVWSLGTSINRLGTSHSILLKVEHAQPVVDAFDDLWEKLEGHVIWPPKTGI